MNKICEPDLDLAVSFTVEGVAEPRQPRDLAVASDSPLNPPYS